MEHSGLIMPAIPTANTRGSVLGGTLLVSGCCIGAGMLGIPILSGIAGFIPSLALFLFSWLYMFATGLLLLEITLGYSATDVNIVTMARENLGKWGMGIAWITFLFLFYCAMVAYVAAAGSLLNEFLPAIFPSPWIGSLFSALFLAAVIFLGIGMVDLFNRFIMIGLIVFYLFLVSIGLPEIEPGYFSHENWHASLFVLPPMIFSFGYHNLVPSLSSYLGGERKRLLKVIFFGSLIPLTVYLVWEVVILGVIPPAGFRQALDQEALITRALISNSTSQWIVVLTEGFAFCAIVTSFLAVALSFIDFLADGLSIEKNSKGKATLCLLTLLPPFILSLIYPNVFQKALSMGGGIATVILFGILPAVMVWKIRSSKDEPPVAPILPGGNSALITIIALSLGILFLELAHEIGWTTP